MSKITRREFLKTTGMAVTALGAYAAFPSFATAATTGKSLARAPITEVLIQESARSIPIAYQCDVIIAGGSSGAVAAAVAATQAGAKVFLATPYHYLGEDLCATLRLWLEGNESIGSPLAQALFPGSTTDQLSFTYTTDVPSIAPHLDTNPPSRLAHGGGGSAEQSSVEYPGDVTITVDLLKPCMLNEVSLLAFHASNFKLASVTISYSSDRTVWQGPVTLTNSYPDQNSTTDPALTFSLPMHQTARYLQFQVKRAPGAARLLLAKIIIQGKSLNSSPTKAQWALTPLQAKTTLDQALLDAKVDFLFGCWMTDVLLDQQNHPAGIVIANRGGRQAILGKVLIDATDRAWLARLAGAQSSAYPSGPASFKRVTIGGAPLSKPGIESSRIIHSATIPSIVEYSLTIPMDDGSYVSWAKAEQQARDLTYQNGQRYAADVLFQVPPDSIPGVQSATGSWPGVAGLPLDAFRPARLANFYLLNGCADLPRDQAAQLLRAPSLIDLGTRIGQAAALQAQSLQAPLDLHFRQTGAATNGTGDVGEALVGVRPIQQLPGIAQPPRTLPVWGTYDVVVVGGGVSGASAGIGAARQGARTLVLDPQHGLGGVGTLGMISQYYYGNYTGFSKEPPQNPSDGSWNVEAKMEWWRSQLRQAGAEIWFGALGCGAFIDQGRVAGVVVATPQGRGIVLAKTVVDATGSADIAASAGVPCSYTDATDIAIQGTGLPFRDLNSNYINTDFTLTDETDLIDTWHLLINGRRIHGGHFDSGQLIDTRERRRIVGDFTLQLTDILNHRTYPDTISSAVSVYDDHIYPTDPFFELANIPYGQVWIADIPYRCLLPQRLEGILVVGLGLSASHDAMPIIRMQRDMQNLGYAAGLAAFMAARDNVSLRQIDIKALQRMLIKKGNHIARILTDTDFYPLSLAQIQRAVALVPRFANAVAVILSHPTSSLPFLQQAYQAAANGIIKLGYARILANLGDTTGLSSLIKAVNGITALDKGWQFDGSANYGDFLSTLDRLVIALGRTRDPKALEPILSKVQLLNANSDFSHHRTFARAIEMLPGRRGAAASLAALLNKPGMQGHWIQTLQQAEDLINNLYDRTVRALSLRELTWARVLYRCGDQGRLGEQILTEYTKDLRGHFARHAHDVLQPGPVTVDEWRMYE